MEAYFSNDATDRSMHANTPILNRPIRTGKNPFQAGIQTLISNNH